MKELTKELEYKINNLKAVDFFGKDIVEKLQEQHQDGYPNNFKKIQSNLWQYGDTSKYIVNLNKKDYVVTVEDNILIHPLFINVITNWEEVEE